MLFDESRRLLATPITLVLRNKSVWPELTWPYSLLLYHFPIQFAMICYVTVTTIQNFVKKKERKNKINLLEPEVW